MRSNAAIITKFGEIDRSEIVALEHWLSSGFANTDFDVGLGKCPPYSRRSAPNGLFSFLTCSLNKKALDFRIEILCDQESCLTPVGSDEASH